MSSTSLPPLTARLRGRFGPQRLAAWLVARATAPATSVWVVIGFAVVHAVLWTAILTNLKAAQDIHMDVAEAYAWGSRFLMGYGKHPPLSGWIAGLWFTVFPVKDWATYALAMAMASSGLVVVWFASLKVVDRRRAFFVLVMVALYPIFNFKGFKYNADLVQLLTLPLVVLAYLHAFEKRSFASGVWLGLAGAAAMMTKYWVLTMIGAIGLAALLHPDRLRFLASPAPWVAIATMLGVGSEQSISGESDLVEAIRESAQSNTARAGDQITQRNLDIQPTITIRPGAPVRVLVTRDLILAPWRRNAGN